MSSARPEVLVFVDVAGIGAGPEATVGGVALDRRAASVAASVDGMVAVEVGRLTPGATVDQLFSSASLDRLAPDAACVVVDACHPLIRREHIEGVASVLADSGGVAAVAVVESGSARADLAALRAFRVSPAQSVGSDATWNVHYRVPWSAGLRVDSADEAEAVGVLLAVADRVAVRRALPADIRAVVFDFDGVLTDNRVLVDQDGRESVVADRSDGMGIEMLRDAGFALAIVSKERNEVVSARARKLGLECVQGVDDKWRVVERWLDDADIDSDALLYVGNDVNDVDCLVRSGCGVVVADAYPEAIRAADLVLTRRGGRGAVRQLADALIDAQR